MERLKLLRVGIALLLASIGLAAYLFLWRPDWLFCWHEFRTGNEIISRVEAFHKNYGRLPETLEDVGFNDPDLNVFYEKVSEDEYRVWFGTTLGQSQTYDSHTKAWG